MNNKIKNPLTGRVIKINGPTHKKLIEDGILDIKGNDITFYSTPKKSSTKKSSSKKSSSKKSSRKYTGYLVFAHDLRGHTPRYIAKEWKNLLPESKQFYIDMAKKINNKEIDLYENKVNVEKSNKEKKREMYIKKLMQIHGVKEVKIL